MDGGFATAVKKLGTIGCTVRIMRPGVRLPHEIDIVPREESGLGPIEEVSMLEIPDDVEETPVVDETAAADTEEVVDSVVEKIAEIEAEAAEEVSEEAVEAPSDSVDEATDESSEESEGGE
jgi:small subunit ribosomal protein S3